MSRLGRAGLHLALALAYGLSAAGALAAGEAAWVDATRLALRESPSAQAPALGYLVTNTRVELLVRGEPWCEVRAEVQAGSRAEVRRGHVVCRFLVAAPLAAERIDAELGASDAAHADPDLLQKRFWIEPSLGRLMAYGQLLDARLVPGGAANEAEPRAPRPRRAEFEAMKQRLQAGWPAPAAPAAMVGDTPADAAALAVLPRIKPSLLKSGPVGLLSALTPHNDVSDSRRFAIDSVHGINGDPVAELARLAAQAASVRPMLRVAEYGPPQAQKYGGFAGAWDIGGAHTLLPGHGVELLVFREEGDTHRARVQGFDSRENQPGIGCDFIGHFVQDRPALGGFAALVQPAQLGVKSARLLERRSLDNRAPWASALLARVNAQGEQGRIVAGKPGRLLSHDLDDDGVADIAWLAIEVDGGDLMSGTAFITYLNRDGRWHEASAYLPKTCGC